MSLLLQDVVVTTIACLAAFVLLQRLKSAVTPSGQSPSCENCPKCEEHRGKHTASSPTQT